MEGVSPLGLDEPAVRAKDVGELERPEIVELGPVEQPVDDLIAPRCRRLGQERIDFLGRRQDAQHVEVDPPDELAVGADLGRLDPHLVELLRRRPGRSRCPGERSAAANPGTSTRWVSRMLATRFR